MGRANREWRHILDLDDTQHLVYCNEFRRYRAFWCTAMHSMYCNAFRHVTALKTAYGILHIELHISLARFKCKLQHLFTNVPVLKGVVG